METLRQQRIAAIQQGDTDGYDRLKFTNVCMDGFEDLLLSTISFSYQDDDDINGNDGIVCLHNGLSADVPNSEQCAVDALKAYSLLYDDVQLQEQQEKTKQRIQAILGDSFDFDLFFKNPQNMLVKTFIRRKLLNDAVRTTIVCSPEQERQIRDRLETGTNKMLRENGLLCVKDDLFSSKAWPVLKLIVPGVAYLFYNEADRENSEWTRVVYGIEVHITGPEFMKMKEEMHHDYEVMRIDKATRDFLDLRPFQLNNMNLIIAFCKAMSRTGEGEEFLRISQVNDMVQQRKALFEGQGIDLDYNPPPAILNTELIRKHYKIILEKVNEKHSEMLDCFIYNNELPWDTEETDSEDYDDGEGDEE